MRLTDSIYALALAALLAGPAAARADGSADLALDSIQHKWAAASYKTVEDDQEKALKALSDEVATLVQQNPGNAALLAWQGIVLSTYAKAKGGLGAIDVAQEALDALNAAAKIDEGVIGGGVDSSIGALYHKVPGWPLGFGDDDLAKQYLEKGLALNPTGIDENYFYGDFLLDKGKEEDARKYLEQALQAPPRPGREDADAGRRLEIESDLAKLKS
jgi:tetratricopeptide (TPR) repeat protein